MEWNLFMILVTLIPLSLFAFVDPKVAFAISLRDAVESLATESYNFRTRATIRRDILLFFIIRFVNSIFDIWSSLRLLTFLLVVKVKSGSLDGVLFCILIKTLPLLLDFNARNVLLVLVALLKHQ